MNSLGTVVKILANFFFVEDEQEEVWECFVRGRAKKEGIEILIGDKVLFEKINTKQGVILKVSERKNKLTKPLASNIDQVLIVFSSINPTLDFYNLDRYLSYISNELQNTEIIICINKIDLENININETYGQNYKVIYISAKKEFGLENLHKVLVEKNTLLTGPSGVGKSSIIKALLPNLSIEIGDLSSINKGKHTTRNVELIRFTDKNKIGHIFDTPGFSKITFTGLKIQDILKTFPELVSLNCEYDDCLHLDEKGCTLNDHLDKDIKESRFNSYIKIVEESKEEKIYTTKNETKVRHNSKESKRIPKIKKKDKEISRRRSNQSIKNLDLDFE